MNSQLHLNEDKELQYELDIAQQENEFCIISFLFQELHFYDLSLNTMAMQELFVEESIKVNIKMEITSLNGR